MPLPAPAGFASRFQQHQQQITDYLGDELRKKNNGENGETTLYPYQIEAALAVVDYLLKWGTSAQPCLIVAPTGSGKSGIINLIPYVVGSRKALVLSPSPVISTQLATCFGDCGFQSSFFGKVRLATPEIFDMYKVLPFVVKSRDDVPRMSSRDLVIVNAQRFGGNSGTSLLSNDAVIVQDVVSSFAPFSTIIVDEAHHYPARTWRAIVQLFRGKQIIFLTATPVHRGLPILGSQQQIAYEIKLERVTGITIRQSDFSELNFPLAGRTLNPSELQQVGNEIHEILDVHDALSPAVQHKAIVLMTQRHEVDIASNCIPNSTFYTSHRSTDQNITDFEEGRARILIVCGKLLEGYDNKDISVCVILRRVRSQVLFTQFVGRCLRTSFPQDPVPAIVISHLTFNQRPMWDEYRQIEILPEEDPLYEDE